MSELRRRWFPPSRWLRAARAERGGLLVPGDPAGHAVDLHLTPDVVVVGGPITPTTGLAWDHAVALHFEEAPVGDAWAISHLFTGDNRQGGVGVRVTGAYVGRTEAIRAATATPRNRWGRYLEPDVAVPLDARQLSGTRAASDLVAVAVLVAVLAARPALRPGLADPGRVERLRRDVTAVRLRIHRLPTGVRRATIEVLSTMRVLGLVHDLGGRPAPGDRVPAEDDAVARILGRLAASPYAEGVEIDEAEVRALVREHLTEVEPWPLHALLA